MPPEPRLLGLGYTLPGEPVRGERIAAALGTTADEIAARTEIARRHYAAAGQGPSDLALDAAGRALAEAATAVSDLGLIVFATSTPDVAFPGAACYLQHKLGAGTIGSLDVRAQSAGFLCALELAAAFGDLRVASGAPDERYSRVLVAAGEVLSSGLDESPRGAELTPLFGDGAAVAVVGRGDRGPRLRAVRWRSEGGLAERFWCEFPASRRYPQRITAAELEAGEHYPRAALADLAPIARQRLQESMTEVLDECGWLPSTVDAWIVDYVDPRIARSAAMDLGVEAARITVPTAGFGHVMAAGLPIALAQRLGGLVPGARVLLAAAGPGVSFGAAALEL